MIELYLSKVTENSETEMAGKLYGVIEASPHPLPLKGGALLSLISIFAINMTRTWGLS